MTGYLGRLISQNSEAKTLPEVKPVVRSASPIVEQDQRIGMFGPDESIAPFPNGHDLETIGEIETGSRQTTKSAFIAGENQSAPLIQRKTMAMPNDNPAGQNGSANSDNVASASSEPQIHQRQSEKPQIPSDQQERSASDTEILDASENFLETRGTDRVGGQNSPAISKPLGSLDEPRADVPKIVLMEPRASSVELRKPRLDSKDDAYALMPPNHGLPKQPEISAPLMAIGPTPRVVIDRINVEVIAPPRIENQAATPKQAQPATAESVSKIGPLEGNIRSHLPLRLRYR